VTNDAANKSNPLFLYGGAYAVLRSKSTLVRRIGREGSCIGFGDSEKQVRCARSDNMLKSVQATR
jgi:hypothetical protein